MKQLAGWSNLTLRGGFVVIEVLLEPKAMTDAIGRPAVAKAVVIGKEIRIRVRDNLSDKEISISLYHEILEAASVATSHPPGEVWELNEAGFEAAAQEMHQMLGPASVVNLNRMLELFGF